MRRNTMKKLQSDEFSWINAIMWGDGNNKMIDFFGYEINGWLWKSNPNVFSWVTKESKTLKTKTPNEITCGKGLIILGAEENYRLLSTQEEYFIDPPKIDGLKFKSKTDFASVDKKDLLKKIWNSK